MPTQNPWLIAYTFTVPRVTPRIYKKTYVIDWQADGRGRPPAADCALEQTAAAYTWAWSACYQGVEGGRYFCTLPRGHEGPVHVGGSLTEGGVTIRFHEEYP